MNPLQTISRQDEFNIAFFAEIVADITERSNKCEDMYITFVMFFSMLALLLNLEFSM